MEQLVCTTHAMTSTGSEGLCWKAFGCKLRGWGFDDFDEEGKKQENEKSKNLISEPRGNSIHTLYRGYIHDVMTKNPYISDFSSFIPGLIYEQTTWKPPTWTRYSLFHFQTGKCLTFALFLYRTHRSRHTDQTLHWDRGDSVATEMILPAVSLQTVYYTHE